MALTLSSAIKAYIEGKGLGISVYRDRPPIGTSRPYVTVSERLDVRPDPLEDGGTSVQTAVELAQVDVWENLRAPGADTNAESPTLAPAIIRALQGAQLGTYGTGPSIRTYMTRVRSAPRLLEDAEGGARLVHTAITVEVFREL